LETIKRSDIPGMAQLKDICQRCRAFWPRNPEKSFFDKALELCSEPQITALKISDFKTLGVVGGDDDRLENRSWYSLIRCSGPAYDLANNVVNSIKYKLEPETAPRNVPNDARDYLAVDMANRLAQREYRFRFMIQRRTNSATMPLDRAMDVWPESESRFVQVATLILPRQNILERGQSEYGQGLAFNIWRTPKVNAPANESSIAVARKTVYMAGAAA
jgi:hypothetical protein